MSLQVHVSKQSNIPDHCRAYALSDPRDKDYQIICPNDHLETCDRCYLVSSVLAEIHDAIEKMSDSNVSSDVVEEVNFIEGQAKQNIWAWKAHLLRCVNQDEARIEVIDALDENSVPLVQDWAMKFLPRKFRESQSDWFAKRGMPWHITVATRRAENHELEMMTFVHVYQTCNQDSCVVLSIMKDVIGKLKSQLPHLKTVFCCYHCGATIVGASFTGCASGVTVKRLDFSDAQGGKGPCDRKAASIKSHMKIHLNQGSNIETAKEMVDAIQSSGGVHGVDVSLCISAKDPAPSLNVKIAGVSLISNIVYNNGSLTVWRAYGIGRGQCIRLEDLGIPQLVQIPDLVKCDEDTATTMPNAHFIKVKSRRQPCSDNSQQCSDTEEETVTETSPAVHTLSCPEEGCMKVYQRFSSLQHHLDLGKHECALEHETLLDRAALGYAERLRGQSGSVPQIEQVRRQLNLSNQPFLPMGWALKSSHVKRTRFTEKQRDYLSSKFRIGESTGKKADAASVSKSMMTARDSNGNRLFSSSEFLTSQQVSSFFSRLSSKRKLEDDEMTESDFEENQNVENEKAFDELRSEVLQEVALTHPICYDRYDICELIANSKLSIFAIQMLKDICEHFDIPTTDIKVKRKAPYIDKLIAFGKNCTCQK